jgi:hypothetical protein
MSEKKKFDSKLYYIQNKEKILEYNRKYFKEYYRRKKMGKTLYKNNIELKNIIIERNVTVMI